LRHASVCESLVVQALVHPYVEQRAIGRIERRRRVDESLRGYCVHRFLISDPF